MKRFRASALFWAFFVTAAPAAHAQSTCDPEGEIACAADVFEPDPPLLVWEGMADPSASIVGDELTLRFVNTRDETVDIDVRIVTDAGGGKRKTRRLVVRGIPAGRSETRSVAVSGLGFDTESMAFAGQILASARIESATLCAGGACKPPKPGAAPVAAMGPGPVIVSAAPLWFHPGAAPGTFEIYGREALEGRFAGGDLAGSTSPEPGVHLLRVRDGGKFAKLKKSHLAEMGVLSYDEDAAAGTPYQPQGPINLAANLLGFCVKWEIGLVDHGKPITTSGGATITEDIWNDVPKGDLTGFKVSGAASDGRMAVTARGVLVRARKGAYEELLTTHPRTGCVSFAGDGEGEYELTVLTEHHDARGNRMLYHDEDLEPYGFKEKVQLKTAKMVTVSVGDFTGEATLAAISGFAMYRTTFGVSNKSMFLRNENTCGKDDEGNPNSDGGANSSAHFNDDDLADGIAYVRIHDGTRDGCSGSDHRRFKFVVTHEIGHAWQLLNQGVFEPDASFTLDDPEETVCTDEGGYTINSLEHSAIGAREGLAHFYAAVIWNSPSSAEAVFTWFGAPENAEGNDEAEPGGRLFNVCTASNKCGRSTNIDWLRHWWDWHTPWLPGAKPDPALTTQAYGAAMNDDGTTRANYFQKLDEATDALPALASFKDEWDHFAELNGVNTSPADFSCLLLSYPACDSADPYEAVGQPGCPCADVEHTLNESAFGDDGFYPDGTASYLFHGQGGTGQYCEDFTPGSPAEAVCNVRAADGAPECLRCGVDTMTACACGADSECQALGDASLVCWGGDDQGWPGTASGRCMPAADTPQGRDALGDVPWICLESCTSRGGGDPDRFVCMYDQRDPEVQMGHAQCVDIVGCTAPAGWCEQSGQLCDTEEICAVDFDDCCVAECTQDAQCATLGFPASYVCDSDPGLPGFCVPNGCDAPAADQDFCDMFR